MNFGGLGRRKDNQPSSRTGDIVYTRQSSGFNQFCSLLHYAETLNVLDMSGASQANISFITGMGHRLSSDDVPATLEQCFGDDFLENQLPASNAQRFLDQTLTFPDEHFDGALVWDTLQFLTPPLLDQFVRELLRIMRRGGLMLCFFNADERSTEIPIHSYRIQDEKTLLLTPRGRTHRVNYFNNRTIERTFEGVSSLKFFLTRDNLREVIVRR